MSEAPILTEDETLDLMAEYGVSSEPTEIFRYRNYRYARLDDALAQARRDRLPG